MSRGGGIVWTVIAAAYIGAAVVTDVTNAAETTAQAFSDQSIGPYRPALWAQPAMTFITVPGMAAQSSAGSVNRTEQQAVKGADGTPTFSASSTMKQGTPDTYYVFDAVMRIEHSRRLQLTQHAVQNTANVSDHAFIEPARVVLEIGMSDVMDSFTPGTWTGSPSKSVAAFQVLATLQQQRQPVTLTTRLDSYTNMLVESIQVSDSHETRQSLRATVTMQQIFTASVTTTPVSARDQTTDSTEIGTKQVVPVPAAVTQQNTVMTPSTVPGAGTFTSSSSDPVDEGDS